MSVRFEPSATAEQVANVVHVHLAGSSSNSDAVALFEGTISSYYLSKFKHGEVPTPLASRQVPVVSWRADAELIVAPLRPLAIGPHSLISKAGLVAEFTVGESRPVLERFWPPPASPASLQFAIYCRPESSTVEPPNGGSLRFEPAGFAVDLAPGLDQDGLFAARCSHFCSDQVLAPGAIAVPPAAVGDWAISPAIFQAIELPAAEPLSCEAGELELGPGCARVADDRVTVRTPAAAMLWIVHTAHGALAEVSAAGQTLTIDGLVPDAREQLWGRVYELSGASQAFEIQIHTAPARERLILNEVLADALGPEPQSEWVELLNAGSLTLDLAEYSLQDGGGRTTLPSAILAPREFALLVRDDFAPNGSDEPPAAGARLIRLPALGKSGLSNAGERLSLVNRAGTECSVMPALAGKAGQSLARRTPTSADDDDQAFAFGTPTPGVANAAPGSAP